MNNEPEVIDDIDIDIESELSDQEPEPSNEGHASAGEEVSEDSLGDTQLGQDLGQLLTEIRRDEENFQQSGETADHRLEADPFDPSNFSLDTPFKTRVSQPEASSGVESREQVGLPEPVSVADTMDSASAESDDETSAIAPLAGASAESDEAASTIAQLVTEIETALQRFTQAERQRADQQVAPGNWADLGEHTLGLQSTAGENNRHCQQERKPRRGLAGQPEKQSQRNRYSGTRNPGYQGQHLEPADEQHILQPQLIFVALLTRFGVGKP